MQKIPIEVIYGDKEGGISGCDVAALFNPHNTAVA